VLGTSVERRDEVAEIYRRVIASSGDDAQSAVEAFNLFLAGGELTPERISDRRWLFEWRASHIADPTSVLIAWAVAEETSFDSPEAAIAIYERVLSIDPEHFDAIAQLARLKAQAGDAEGALGALRSLAEKSTGDSKTEILKRIVAISIEQLARPLDALPLLDKLLEEHPTDPEALRLVQSALGFDESRAPAAALLGRAAESAETLQARADVLEALLAVSAKPRARPNRPAVESLLECRARIRGGLQSRCAASRSPARRADVGRGGRCAQARSPEPVAAPRTRASGSPEAGIARLAHGRVLRRMVRMPARGAAAGLSRRVVAERRLGLRSPKLAFNAQARWGIVPALH
jgi:tetratricopeptide (TPR) repeat protein